MFHKKNKIKYLVYPFNPTYMNQKLAKYPIRTNIIIIPGTVNPSNNPKTQKPIEPADKKKKFFLITPEV